MLEPNVMCITTLLVNIQKIQVMQYNLLLPIKNLIQKRALSTADLLTWVQLQQGLAEYINRDSQHTCNLITGTLHIFQFLPFLNSNFHAKLFGLVVWAWTGRCTENKIFCNYINSICREKLKPSEAWNSSTIQANWVMT